MRCVRDIRQVSLDYLKQRLILLMSQDIGGNNPFFIYFPKSIFFPKDWQRQSSCRKLSFLKSMSTYHSQQISTFWAHFELFQDIRLILPTLLILLFTLIIMVFNLHFNKQSLNNKLINAAIISNTPLYATPIPHPMSQVTVIPYAFASVFRQLEAVRALEERTSEKLKHNQMRLCLFW